MAFRVLAVFWPPDIWQWTINSPRQDPATSDRGKVKPRDCCHPPQWEEKRSTWSTETQQRMVMLCSRHLRGKTFSSETWRKQGVYGFYQDCLLQTTLCYALCLAVKVQLLSISSVECRGRLTCWRLAGLFICPNKCWLVIMARTKIRWGHYSDSRPNVVTLVWVINDVSAKTPCNFPHRLIIIRHVRHV